MVDVLAGQVPRGRRQVVRGHRGQHERPVVLGGERRAVHVALEPQHRRAEHPALGQVVAHPRLDDAEVLADDDGAGAVRLEREDADERLVVVADVRAVGGVGALGDPPQPEQPDDVVDPDGARVPQHGAQHVAVRPVRGARQGVGTPRRLRPVLALLVVHVRRRADGRARAQHVRRAPRRPRPRGCTPTARSCMMPERHAAVERGALRGGELLVGDPLQPAVERRCARPARRAAAATSVGATGPCASAGHAAPVVLLGERAPQREVLEPLALAARGTRRTRACRAARARRGEDDLERGALGGPRRRRGRSGRRRCRAASTASAGHSTSARSAADR